MHLAPLSTLFFQGFANGGLGSHRDLEIISLQLVNGALGDGWYRRATRFAVEKLRLAKQVSGHQCRKVTRDTILFSRNADDPMTDEIHKVAWLTLSRDHLTFGDLVQAHPHSDVRHILQRDVLKERHRPKQLDGIELELCNVMSLQCAKLFCDFLAHAFCDRGGKRAALRLPSD